MKPSGDHDDGAILIPILMASVVHNIDLSCTEERDKNVSTNRHRQWKAGNSLVMLICVALPSQGDVFESLSDPEEMLD